MSITYKINIAPSNVNATGFAANVTGAVWPLTTTAIPDGLGHKVTITNNSANTHAAKTVTITGTDADGKGQVEVLNLPAGSTSVKSTKYFRTIQSVVPSATIGADTMGIGWSNEVSAQMVRLNRWMDTGALLQMMVSGTASATVEVTAAELEEPFTQDSLPWIASGSAAFTAPVTANKLGTLETHLTGCRIRLGSYTDGAVVAAYFSESGARG